jgi:hypothetical protein
MNPHLKDTLRFLAEATGLEVRKTSVYTSQNSATRFSSPNSPSTST